MGVRMERSSRISGAPLLLDLELANAPDLELTRWRSATRRAALREVTLGLLAPLDDPAV
jgi:hypothetical protein